ncbi:MAG: alpha/beta hydrolase [Acidimicrobiia bacterium]
MKERVNLSSWKSAKAEQRFRELEDELLRDSGREQPVPVDVETRLGPTRAYRWDGAGIAVVFLHGVAGTGLSWIGYAEHRGARVAYAIDTIGDVGRSEQQVAVEGPDDLAEWLDTTLAALGVEHAHLVGTSYGGFLALNLAARRPARVQSLVLIDTAGVLRISIAKFLLWGVPVLFASLLPDRPRAWAAKRLRMPALEDKRLMRTAFYAQRNHRARQVRPEPLSDEQLRSIVQPTLMIQGAKSEMISAVDVKARVEALMPDVVVEVVPDAGHAVMLSAMDEIIVRMNAFQADHDAEVAS